MFKRIVRFCLRLLLFGALFLSLLSLITAYTMPRVSRCFWMGLNADFMQVEGVYMSKNTPKSLLTRLLADIELAKKRNQAFWQDVQSAPQIIYCHQLWQYNKLGIQGKPATTLLTFTGAYVVLAPTGNKLDIISHELCHAELLAQIGWFARDRRIPTWFDEGLAMQLDYRPYYDERKLAYFGASRLQQIDITNYKSPSSFFSKQKGKTRLHYILAKQKVHQWLGEQPQARLQDFCKHMRKGMEFQEAFGK